jgi:hypothetical protein
LATDRPARSGLHAPGGPRPAGFIVHASARHAQLCAGTMNRKSFAQQQYSRLSSRDSDRVGGLPNLVLEDQTSQHRLPLCDAYLPAWPSVRSRPRTRGKPTPGSQPSAERRSDGNDSSVIQLSRLRSEILGTPTHRGTLLTLEPVSSTILPVTALGVQWQIYPTPAIALYQ